METILLFCALTVVHSHTLEWINSTWQFNYAHGQLYLNEFMPNRTLYTFGNYPHSKATRKLTNINESNYEYVSLSSSPIGIQCGGQSCATRIGQFIYMNGFSAGGVGYVGHPDFLVFNLSNENYIYPVNESFMSLDNFIPRFGGCRVSDTIDNLWLIGGFGQSSVPSMDNITQRYTVSTDTWTILTELPILVTWPSCAYYEYKYNITYFKPFIYVFWWQNVFKYDISSDIYTSISTNSHLGAYGGNAIVGGDNNIYLMGSTNDKTRVDRYNPYTNEFIFDSRRSVSGFWQPIVVDYDIIFVFGGSYSTRWMEYSYIYIPTQAPTDMPTMPSNMPTYFPTNLPTKHPTNFPTATPTKSPTNFPTATPTKHPTKSPTKHPTKSPTQHPTNIPTATPTKSPTNFPTATPTTDPTNDPTIDPTIDPTTDPTTDPTIAPTMAPSLTPSLNPSLAPSVAPSIAPSISPTLAPSIAPTSMPTPTCHCAKFKGEMIVSSNMNRNDILWGGESFVSYNCRYLLKLKKNGNIIFKHLVGNFINPFEKDQYGNYIRNINDRCAQKISRNGWEIGWNTSTLIANHSGESIPKLMLQDGSLVIYEEKFKNVPAIKAILLWRSNDAKDGNDMILRLTDEACLMLHKYGENAKVETAIWYKCLAVENDDTNTDITTTFITSFYDYGSHDDDAFDNANTNGNISDSSWWIWLLIILLFLCFLITFICFKRYSHNKKLISNIAITSKYISDEMDADIEGYKDGDMETTQQIEQWFVETNNTNATVTMASGEFMIEMQHTDEPKVMSN